MELVSEDLFLPMVEVKWGILFLLWQQNYMRVYGTEVALVSRCWFILKSYSSSTSDAATGKRLETNHNGVEVTGNRVIGDVIAFVSDDRLKINKVGLTNALDKVNSAKGFTYNFNETAGALGLQQPHLK